MITYKGLPAPLICDHLSRAAVARALRAGHRVPDRQASRWSPTPAPTSTARFIATPTATTSPTLELDVDRELLDAVVVRVTGMSGRAIPRGAFAALDVRGKAVLVHTGWDRHWRTDQYFEGHPFLTADAAAYLRDAGATLVGIDSLNIDDTADRATPVHTTLLGAGIPIVEHLCGLEQLPNRPFRFCAAPARVRGMGTFPVRAYARC